MSHDAAVLLVNVLLIALGVACWLDSMKKSKN